MVTIESARERRLALDSARRAGTRGDRRSAARARASERIAARTAGRAHRASSRWCCTSQSPQPHRAISGDAEREHPAPHVDSARARATGGLCGWPQIRRRIGARHLGMPPARRLVDAQRESTAHPHAVSSSAPVGHGAGEPRESLLLIVEPDLPLAALHKPRLRELAQSDLRRRDVVAKLAYRAPPFSLLLGRRAHSVASCTTRSAAAQRRRSRARSRAPAARS